MAATQTVAQQFPLRKPSPTNSFSEHDSTIQYSEIQPRHGVITLSGYGLAVRVDRGHLLLEDGVGGERRRGRLPRVDHGLRRLVVIGSDGHVSLAALRWLADQNAAFAMLERDGTVLITTGPARSYDARLRRAQAMALHNGTAFRLSREIIDRKLAGQERVALQRLNDGQTALEIRQYRSELAEAESIDALRLIESQGAKAYWAAWRSLSISFPRKDLPRIPEHWRSFGSRMSPLSGYPRVAANPVNAILNYLYAILEAETRLAAATLGLDPAIGVLHMDAPYRDSLACDLMEPIRPEVDAFVLDWLQREILSRNEFVEQRNGNCRLMDSLASKLSQTAPTWARLVAPVAEWFARELHHGRRSVPRRVSPRLTQQYRREANGAEPLPNPRPAPRPGRTCRGCGREDLRATSTYCKHCGGELNAERMEKFASAGRTASQKPDAQAKRSATQKVNARARYDWNPADQPNWLTERFFRKKIQPNLAALPRIAIVKALKVSKGYANEIRKGRLPHPRHWQRLAELSGLRSN